MDKRLIIIVVSWMYGIFSCNAQSLSSVEEQYFDQRCEEALVVCINPFDNNGTVICYNDSISQNPNFIYHTHSGTGVSKRFQWPSIANTFGSVGYKVNDMIIIGGTCYFCGSKSSIIGYEYTLEDIIPIFQITGFFGSFLVSQISIPGSTMLDLYLFDLPTGELKRMDGVYEAGDVELGLISEHTLAIVKGFGGSWACHVQDVATSKRLEDIRITANHLVTLSRFSGSPYSFGLRCETKTDAFLSPVTHTLNNYYNGIRYNTLLMTTASLLNETPTVHHENEVMRMVGHPVSDLVTVAYDGEFDNGDCQHFWLYTPMYMMNLSNCSTGYVNISMDNAKLVTTTLLKPAQYSLLEMCYVPTANAISMLHGMKTEEYGMWSILQALSWSSSWTPRSVQSDYNIFKSMDVGANGWAYLAGWRMPEKALSHFRQDGGMMERSCYSTRPTSVTEELLGEEEEESVIIEPSPVPIFTITQTHYEIEATAPGYFPECKTSY